MKFTVDHVAYGNHYIEVKIVMGQVELGVGYHGSMPRSSVSDLTRKQALVLSGALQALAWTLDDPTSD